MQRPGQYNKDGILFSRIKNQDATKQSYVKDCSFHHGLGPTVGLIGSSGKSFIYNSSFSK